MIFWIMAMKCLWSWVKKVIVAMNSIDHVIMSVIFMSSWKLSWPLFARLFSVKRTLSWIFIHYLLHFGDVKHDVPHHCSTKNIDMNDASHCDYRVPLFFIFISGCFVYSLSFIFFRGWGWYPHRYHCSVSLSKLNQNLPPFLPGGSSPTTSS